MVRKPMSDKHDTIRKYAARGGSSSPDPERNSLTF